MELQTLHVMAGRVPAIHAFNVHVPKTWMPGTSPGMMECIATLQ
jgi:hypothetical protein